MAPFLVLVPSALLMFVLPRRSAYLPLLVIACYMTRVPLDLGPFHFSVLRILICVGIARVLARHERVPGGLNELDRWMAAWAVWFFASVFFHRDPTAQLITRLGNLLDAGGLYFLFRVFIGTKDDLLRVIRVLPILLTPLAILMLYEKVAGYDVFSILGGVDAAAANRDGRIRAHGPFDNPILAGTAAAGCVPLILALWRDARGRMMLGTAAALGMIYASNSSGPIMTAATGLGALLLWPWRHSTRYMRWAAVAGYGALAVVMNDPPYFMLARIDLTGSSTGWHRAELIKAAIDHLSEWWLIGTDRTVHWMPYGIPWSPDHADITNHYLQMGVLGGVLLMFLFIMGVVKAFAMIGDGVRDDGPTSSPWLAWALGASLFSHAVTFVSIAYYDQTMVFLYLDLALASALAVPAAGTVFAAAPPKAVVITPSKWAPRRLVQAGARHATPGSASSVSRSIRPSPIATWRGAPLPGRRRSNQR